MRKLTEEQIDESIMFARGASVTTGHVLGEDEENAEFFEDLREVLAGNLSDGEMTERIYRRAMSQ